MSSLKKLIFIYITLDLIMLVCAVFIGIKWILNTQISFLCALLIFIASAVSYKNRLNEGFLPKFRAFFAPFKIAGYVFLILAFILLNKTRFFEPFAFLIGISPLILGALIFAFLNKKDEICL